MTPPRHELGAVSRSNSRLRQEGECGGVESMQSLRRRRQAQNARARNQANGVRLPTSALPDPNLGPVVLCRRAFACATLRVATLSVATLKAASVQIATLQRPPRRLQRCKPSSGRMATQLAKRSTRAVCGIKLDCSRGGKHLQGTKLRVERHAAGRCKLVYCTCCGSVLPVLELQS